jgi:phosphoserine phosphatase/NAD-dependent SIR2 family protein deacetylase
LIAITLPGPGLENIKGRLKMLPPLPPSLAQRFATLLIADQLVLFVGAGISHQATCAKEKRRKMPLWRDLANAVARICHENPENYANNILDLFDAIEANRSRGALEDAIRIALADSEFAPAKLHLEIAGLPWHRIYTTNYDSVLARAVGETEPIDNEQKYEWLRRERDRQPRLIHVHGTLGNMGTLTGNDFSLWPERNPIAHETLRNIALNKTILFVGYSFSDPHLKFGILPWVIHVNAGRGKRHYALMWDVTQEQIKLMDKRDQIEVVPIIRDNDWLAAFRQIASAHTYQNRQERKKSQNTQRSIAPIELSPDDAIVNGYKLFFYRTKKQLSIRALSSNSGVDAGKINNLEQVKIKVEAGPNCFKTASRDELRRIERALGCAGRLEFGQNDDFLATFILYYKVNRKRGKEVRKSATAQLDFAADTKAVVFDFGGTLTKSASPVSTWERMWLAVDYTIDDAGHFHRQFIAGNITHQQWCDATCEKLRSRGFSKTHMRRIIDEMTPIGGLKETLATLHNQGISLHIVSGSVREIIQSVLGESFELFHEVKANEFIYDSRGVVKEIRGHQFDFEGKARFISRVIQERNCQPLEVLFVGNSLNDSWASESGARTLCVNPTHVDYSNTLIWTDHIKDMKSLNEILRYAKRVTG